MEHYAKSYGIFLLFLVATNVIVAPIVRKMIPNNAQGTPVITLL